jgi:hypothetical protein
LTEDIGIEFGFIFDDEVLDLLEIPLRVCERWLAIKHLVTKDSQRPNINLFRMTLVQNYFRG